MRATLLELFAWVVLPRKFLRNVVATHLLGGSGGQRDFPRAGRPLPLPPPSRHPLTTFLPWQVGQPQFFAPHGGGERITPTWADYQQRVMSYSGGRHTPGRIPDARLILRTGTGDMFPPSPSTAASIRTVPLVCSRFAKVDRQPRACMRSSTPPS